MSDGVDGVAVDAAGRPTVWPLLLAVVASLVLGAALGVLALSPETAPSDTSPEAGFARDMSVHHAQAVELAFLVYDRTDDPEIRRLAYDIINTQRTQIGMFSGWLQEWGLSQTTSRAPMMWSDHAHADAVDSYADMPGMASTSDLARLRASNGEAAETAFLELMIAHHQGGVDMAQSVISLTDRPTVQRLARTIVEGQQAEATAMAELLADRTQ